MALKERYETGKAPHIRVENVAGSLVVKAWDESSVGGKGDHGCMGRRGFPSLFEPAQGRRGFISVHARHLTIHEHQVKTLFL